MKKQRIVLAEHKCLTLAGGVKIRITLVNRLSQARKYVRQGKIVLLDRYQVKGKSVIIFPAQFSVEDLKGMKSHLQKMTEMIKMSKSQKFVLLKFKPEVCEKVGCYEVLNHFAAMIRDIQAMSEDVQA